MIAQRADAASYERCKRVLGTQQSAKHARAFRMSRQQIVDVLNAER